MMILALTPQQDVIDTILRSLPEEGFDEVLDLTGRNLSKDVVRESIERRATS